MKKLLWLISLAALSGGAFAGNNTLVQPRTEETCRRMANSFAEGTDYVPGRSAKQKRVFATIRDMRARGASECAIQDKITSPEMQEGR